MKQRTISSWEYIQIGKFIDKMCRRYGKNLDQAECQAEAWFAYWEAKITYSRYEGCCDFWSYVFLRIREKLDVIRAIRNQRISSESTLSLNQTVGDAKEPVEMILFPIQGDFTKYQIMRKLSMQETDQEIMDSLHLNACQYGRLKSELRQDLQVYLEMS